MRSHNPLKTKIASGQPTLGVWLGIPSPTVAEIAGLSGFDYAIIDSEHGPIGLETSIDMMRALAGSGTEALIRVPSHDPNYLKRVLDAGAESLMIPMVNSAEQAADIVSACRYPPLGRRGYAAPAVRASGYGTEPDYVGNATGRLFIAAQIETPEAVENAAAIGAVEGIDLLFLGSGDLSGAMGHIEQPGHDSVKAMIEKFQVAANSAGTPIGGIPRPGLTVHDLATNGWMMVAGAVDTMMLRAAFADEVETFRKRVGTRAQG